MTPASNNGAGRDDAMLKQLLAVKERRRDRAHRQLIEVRKRCRHARARYDQQEGELIAMRHHHAARIQQLRQTISSQPATGASHVALQSQEALFRKEEGRKAGEVNAAASHLHEAERATAAANDAYLQEVRAVEKVKELRRLARDGKAV